MPERDTTQVLTKLFSRASDYRAYDEHPKQQLHDIGWVINDYFWLALFHLRGISTADSEGLNVWVDNLVVIACFEFLKLKGDKRYFIPSGFEEPFEEGDH